MGIPAGETLQELRAELRARVSFVNQGSGSLLSETLMNSFLTNAQLEVWYDLKIWQRRTTIDIVTAISQVLYDWPDSVDPTKTRHVSVLNDQIWEGLKRGIDNRHDTFVTTGTQISRRWDMKGSQLEIWPEPDAIYTLRIDHYPRLATFVEDTDRLSMPKALVFNLALYKAKLHFKQEDAAEALGAHDKVMFAIRSGQNEGLELRRDTRINRRRRQRSGIEPLPPPVPSTPF